MDPNSIGTANHGLGRFYSSVLPEHRPSEQLEGTRSTSELESRQAVQPAANSSDSGPGSDATSERVGTRVNVRA